MKRVLSVFLVLVMVITAFPMAGLTSFAETSGDWEYSVSDNEVTITKYNGSAMEITIPVAINGNSVTKIGESAFDGCKSLKSITIPSSINNIGSYAFQGCSSLTDISIPNSVASIGNCSFKGCTSLESITIPDSITSIGAWAFLDCTSLENIIIGNGVKRMGKEVFSNTSYYNNDSNWQNGVLYIGKCLIQARTGIIGDYEILPGTQCIALYAFKNCTLLQGISIPGSVSVIERAFEGCSSLLNVTIAEGVEEIGQGTFYDCNSVQALSIPSTLAKIDFLAFARGVGSQFNAGTCQATIYYNPNADYSQLMWAAKSIIFPDGLTYVKDSAFERSPNITDITIPNSVNSIGNNAFKGCNSTPTVHCNCGSYGSQYAKMMNYNLDSVGPHVWGDEYVIEEATCTKAGKKVLTCVSCGETYEETIPIIEHKYNSGVVTTLATCTAKGVKTYTCEACGNTYTEEIPSLGHSYDVNGVCTGCGDWNNKLNTPELLNVTNLPNGILFRWNELAGAEGYMVYRKKSTDTGWKMIAGSVSGTSYLDISVDNGTTYVYTVKGYRNSVNSKYNTTGLSITYVAFTHYDAVEPTCTERGNIEYWYNPVNGKYYSDAEGTNEISLNDTRVPARGHNFVNYISNDDATCTRDGTKTAVCSNGCGAKSTIVDTGSALGHVFEHKVSLATCTSEGEEYDYCSRCHTKANVVHTPTTDHIYNNGIVTKAATCTDKGIKTYTCSECGDSYTESIPALGHSYNSRGVCTRCGDWQNKGKAPELVSITNAANGVKINWKELAGSEAYYVYRKEANTGWKKIASGVNGTSYVDTKAIAGTKYTYTIKAYIGAINSKYDTAGLTIIRLTNPSFKLANTNDGVKVSWSTVTGSKIYYIYRKDASSAYKKIASSTSLYYVDKTTKAGTKYTYAVRAVNDSVLSAYTGVVIVRLATPSVAVANTKNGPRISYNKITGTNGYYIYRKTASGSYSRIATTTSLSYVDKTAKTNTKYYYAVRAYNGSYLSAYTNNAITCKK